MNETTTVVPLEWRVDDRGKLVQIFDSDLNAKRIYIVGNFSKGVIRGFHGHMREWKHFFVIKGCAKFVVVPHEVDRGVSDPSKLLGKIETYVLSDKKPSILSVPPHHYNGWVSLEDDTILMGISDKNLEESINDDFRIDPFTFGDVWGVKKP